MTDQPLLSPLIEHATELAAQWHDRTYRKGRWRDAAFKTPPDEPLAVPVMAHVTAVAMIAQRAGWGEATVAAAFLHDALEDTSAYGTQLRRTELRAAIGEEVAALVETVTETKRDPESGAFRPWRARKEEYIRKLRAGRPEAVAVSLADKLHNLWTMNEGLGSGTDIFSSAEDRTGLSAGPEEQRWFYRAVLDASRRHDDERLAPLRASLEKELQRFEALALGSGGPTATDD